MSKKKKKTEAWAENGVEDWVSKLINLFIYCFNKLLIKMIIKIF